MEQKKKSIPKLNEDVIGKILKFVIINEQKRLLETKMFFSEVKDIDLRIEWPQILQLNTQRLVHHKNVKLLSKSTLYFDFWRCSFHASPKVQIFRPFKATDNFCNDWQTMKHFGCVTIRTLNGMSTYKKYDSPVDLLLSNPILRGTDYISEASKCNSCRLLSTCELTNSENAKKRNKQRDSVLPGRLQVKFVSN